MRPEGQVLVEPESAGHPWPWILLLSAALSLFLVWLIYLRGALPAGPAWVERLPALNALLNALAGSCLVAGFIQIRRGNRRVHIRFMLTALGFSGLFLASYVTYHHFHGDTPFPGQGWIRPVYFTVLISHILCSVVAVPMILATLWRATRGDFARHRRIARWTFPIWLYVSVTGVLVFATLRAYS
ncbi:MAG: DUF420 domain-containing protein [Myxococcales bacterium]|nr:DUF420 domain-containing protein [Myxococcales bacterium]